MHKRINIGVIGCGAGAVAFLKHLIEILIEEKTFNLTIKIFDSAKDFGAGLAYQADLDNLLLNKPMETMSAHATRLNEFFIWLNQHPEFLKYKITESEEDEDRQRYIPRVYLPRWVFGLYLNDALNSVIAESRKYGIEISLLQAEVTDIHALHPFAIEATGEDIFFADYLVFCTGNNQPRDIYRLGNTPKYINTPYPLSNQIPQLIKDSTESIGIIGSSLTAVDVAISLRKFRHAGPIAMVSRFYMPVRARGPLAPLKPQHLTVDAIHQIVKKKGTLTLWESIRLLRKDLKDIDCDWRFLFRELDPKIKFGTFLENEIEASRKEAVKQRLG